MPVDVLKRLDQWKIEATDPTHPNYAHADLDHPMGIYVQVKQLVQKLREETALFDKTDVAALIGALNSGNRMKNMIANRNELPTLRDALLTLLDGEGSVNDKIAHAETQIVGGGPSILGELYGWVHAEEAPLYNHCATEALQHLGYPFDVHDYEAFVAAHEQFKQVYVDNVGYIRPDLPLNLEIDKLYNVIDKVDLKQNHRTLAAPFNKIFTDFSHAEWAFSLLHHIATQLGIKGPDDERFVATLRHNSTMLRLNFCLWMIVDFTKDTVQLVLAHDVAPQDERISWHEDFANLVNPDRPIAIYTIPLDLFIERNDEFIEAFNKTAPLIQAQFKTWESSIHRRANRPKLIAAILDPAQATYLLTFGKLTETTQPFESPSQAITEGSEIAEQFEGFSVETFRFFNELIANNNFEWMAENKHRYQTFMRKPMKALFTDVGQALKPFLDPHLLPDSLEITPNSNRTLSKIKRSWSTKSADYHAHYWGAFYRVGYKKQTDAQLFINIHPDSIRVGFYMGVGADKERRQFQARVQNNPAYCLELIEALNLRDTFQFCRVHGDVQETPISVNNVEDILKWVEVGDYDVLRRFDRSDPILTVPAFADVVFATLKQIFPLFLLAVTDDYEAAIDNYLVVDAPDLDGEDEEDEIPSTPFTKIDFLHETHLKSELMNDLVAMLHDKQQLILQGPPGTGKTFVAQRLARLLTGLAEPPTDRVETVQFHPAYSYEDFIEGIRPKSSQQNGRHVVEYPAAPGTFRKFCLRAQKQPNQKHVFIIDEINRGNIPRIFGELMLLLEYRQQTVTLPYSGKQFSIPPNVYLIGTMNTADRSIALVDFALRRRFHFVSFQADPDLFDRWLEAHPLPISYMGTLYRQLAAHAIDDKQFAIGPSHFMDEGLTEEKLERVWRWSIVPYLREYYFDQPAKADEWVWNGARVRRIREQNGTV